MLLLASNFFCKETGIYIIALHFNPPTGDLNWVKNFHFHDTCCEHSFHLAPFHLATILPILTELSWLFSFCLIVRGMDLI